MRATDDGRCIFDIYARENESDQASMNDFRRAANSLIHECVSGGTRTEGGIAIGIGASRSHFFPLCLPHDINHLLFAFVPSLARCSSLTMVIETLGQRRRLGLIMTSYQPSVRCSNIPRPDEHDYAPEDCDEILLEMPATKNFEHFGTNIDPHQGIRLPFELMNGKICPMGSRKTTKETCQCMILDLDPAISQ